MLIGLTGGIACGKSTVANILKQRGFMGLDTDDVAHECLDRSSECFDQVVAIFGSDILNENGAIDRSKLGRIVFSEPQKLQALEQVVHPVIQRRWREWAKERKEKNENAFVTIPLLFEVGAHEGWDAIICVSAPRDVMLRRLEERGMSREDAVRRITSQWPLEKKEEGADYVLHNDGTILELEEKINELLERLDV